MEITIEQLQKLLDRQKLLCKQKFDEVWWKSDLVKELTKIDPGERIVNKVHEVRDPIMDADYPNDFYVLEKYKV
jgi:hypothetical protein